MELLERFPEEHLTEAESYRKAETYLKKLRRGADPRDNHHFYLTYGSTESEATKRLEERLRRPRNH